jgi:hypothetical protein
LRELKSTSWVEDDRKVDRLVRPNTANEYEPVHTCQAKFADVSNSFLGIRATLDLLDAPFGASAARMSAT